VPFSIGGDGWRTLPKKPQELQDARNRIVNAIVDALVEMTQRLVREVNDCGNVGKIAHRETGLVRRVSCDLWRCALREG
jgi:hypothetical protein